MLGSYNQLATEVYDIDKPLGHSFPDVEFYRERLASCTGRILEPACGSGRVLIPLLQVGLTVDGMDSSPHMLDACRAHCRERNLTPVLYEGNFQNFSLPHRYEAIIMPAGSFLLLENRQACLESLDCFRRYLVPDGRLIMDSFLQTDFVLNQVSTKTWTTPGGDVITMESKLVEVDFLNQYTVTYLRYDKWRDGRLVQSELQRLPLRWFGVEEFTLLLQKVGYTDIVISADYQFGVAPTHASQTITYEARRT